MTSEILHGDCLEVLKTLRDGSVQCCVTSPPYWGLRDYGVDGQIGLEVSVNQYLEKIVSVFREVRRVLSNVGTCWINLGDTYNTRPCTDGTSFRRDRAITIPRKRSPRGKGRLGNGNKSDAGLKPKDLCGIPWRVAFALQADGWYLRSDIIWCLSGGSWIYAKTKKGEMPMMLKDAARLDPKTVKLWNGEKWTQVLGWSRTSRNADELELVLRSGERISCTPTHIFPTKNGLTQASKLIRH